MLGLVAVLLGLIAVILSVGTASRILGRLPSKPARRVRVDVLGRTSVAPKQGIAVVRAGRRLMVVSVGDGGVRKLADLLDVDVEESRTGPDPEPRSWRRTGHLEVLTVAGLLLTAAGLGAADLAAHAEWAAAPPVAAAPVTSALAPSPVAAAPVTSALAPSLEPATQEPVAPPGPSRISPDELSRLAEQLGISQAGDDSSLRIDGPVGMVLFMGLLAILPTLVLLMTSFTRILVVLHFLRQALGTQTAPPSHLLAALAFLLTVFVMGPTLDTVHQGALRPWMDGEIEQAEMLGRAQGPFRDFMLDQTRESDLIRFVEMSDPVAAPASPDDVSLGVLVSAFVTSELRTAFQIGFALFLPFVIIDVVVASVLMSMGMFMLPPVMVSLPIKLLLFVLVDGWGLVVEGLVTSF